MLRASAVCSGVTQYGRAPLALVAANSSILGPSAAKTTERSLTSMLFSIGVFINALFAESFDDVSIVPTFILTPLSYLGGIFYSIDLLPEFWRTVSLGNPILYMVNTLRHAVLGSSDLPLMNMSVNFALLMIVCFIVVFFFVALWLLNRGKGIRT